MKSYDHEKIQKLLDPIFEMMEQEYPNNAKLVINRFSAEIIYEHTDMAFLKNHGTLIQEPPKGE